MTGRRFILLVLLIAGFMVASSYFGESTQWVLLAVMAAGSIALSLRTDKLIDRLAARVAKQPNPGQTLLNLENHAIRPELESRLAVEAPPVPLRGDAEYFSYPKSTFTVMRLTGVISLGFMGLIIYLAMADPGQLSPNWYDNWPVAFFFAIGGSYCVYSGWFAPLVYEVTGEHLAALGWRGVQRRIPWADVTSCRATHSELRIAAGRTVIRAGFHLVEYGRFVNLVVSRVPADRRR